MKPHLIKWIDITHDSGWHTVEEFNNYVTDKRENLVTQLGFIYSQDRRMTIIVDSWIGVGDDMQYGVIHKIPTDCIVEIKELT